MRIFTKIIKKIIQILDPLTLGQLKILKSKFPKEYFGKNKRGTKEKYYKLFKETIKNESSMIRNFESKSGYKINIDWLNDLALHTQIVFKESALNFEHGRVLYSSLREYLNNLSVDNPFVVILETGTARGFSSLCMSKALDDASVNGTIISLDCLPHNQPMYWNCIDDHDSKKTRAELLKPWKNLLINIIFVQCWTNEFIPNLGLSRVNFAFLDAQHSYKSVMEEFNFVSKLQCKGDIIIFDDVTSGKFPGIVKAVNEIALNKKYKILELRENPQRGYAIARKL